MTKIYLCSLYFDLFTNYNNKSILEIDQYNIPMTRKSKVSHALR